VRYCTQGQAGIECRQFIIVSTDMSSTGKILGGIAALVLLGVVVWMLMGNKADAPVEEDTANIQGEPVAALPEEEPSVFSGSVSDLAKRQGSYRCSVSRGAQADNAFDGIVFANSGKVRSDFTMPQDGVMVESHAIIDGEWMYTWSSAMPQGIKMKIPQGDQPVAAAPGSDASMESDYSWECDDWREDPSVFVPPADVSFMEFSMPAGMPQGMPGAAPAAL
jgi:hypothetical protein